MKQRIQVTILLVIIAFSGLKLWPQIMGEDSLLGPRSARERPAVPFQAEEVPVIGLATPGPMAGETFDREREDIFSYEVDPVERRRQGELARALAEAEAIRRQKEQDEARVRAEEAARLKAEEDRLAREQAEKDRLARLETLSREPEPPPPEVPEEPLPPEFPYRYDGLVGPRGDAIAILRDRDDDYAYARAGQILDQAFRIERVGQLKLVLSYVDPLFAGEFQQVPLRLEQDGIGLKPTDRR